MHSVERGRLSADDDDDVVEIWQNGPVWNKTQKPVHAHV